jgi:hypothetical protein
MKRKPHDQLVTPAGQKKLKSFGGGTEFDHGPTVKNLQRNRERLSGEGLNQFAK